MAVGMVPGMAKVTIHIPDEMYEQVMAFVDQSDSSLSALAVRGLRAQMVAHAVRNHEKRLANDSELAAWHRMRDEIVRQRMAVQPSSAA